MKIVKWGNSLVVRIPASLVETLQLRDGDEIEIFSDNARFFTICKKPGADVLLERLRACRGRLPANFKFSRDQANGHDLAHYP